MGNEVALPNFQAIGNAAIEREVGAGTPPTETPAITPPATPPVSTQNPTPNPTNVEGQTAAVQATQPTGVQGDPAQQLVEVDFGNGRTEKLTIAQIKDGLLRQQDYTRKTQEVAAQRQQIEAAAQQLSRYQQQVEFAQQLAANPQLAKQWADAQLAQQMPQLPADPNQPITVGQAQQLIQTMDARIQAANQFAQRQVQAAQQFGQQYVEDRLQVADFGTKINQTLDSLFQQHPVMKLNPNFEDMVRYEVTKANPQSIEETVQLFNDNVKNFDENLRKHYQSQFQQSQTQVQNLAKTGIELPGGSALPVQQQQFVKNGKLDWNALKDATKKQYGG